MILSTPTASIALRTDIDGVVRVAGTRVTLDTLIIAFLEGSTPEEIAQQYPTVPLADIYSVLGYYLHHREQVDAYLAQRRELADRVRQELDAKYDLAGVRERLLGRKAAQKNAG